ncbi:MAG: leucine-rich repeat protein [Clostridia bacterium]
MKNQKKTEEFKFKKGNAGITLIALVITIIVLLILAGISVIALIGENGLVNRASSAKVNTEYSTVKELMQSKVTEYNMSKLTENHDKTLIEYLQEQQIIDSNNIINVVKLVGTRLSTGNGTGTSDVYKLEEVTEIAKLATTQSIQIAEAESKSYKIVYYTISSEIVEVGNISNGYTSPSINWDIILSNLENEEKRAVYLSQAISKGQSNTNKDVGIGTNGQVVNLDLWEYQIINSGTGIGLYEGTGSGIKNGYDNSNITEDGKIQGTVPQCIYKYDEDEVYFVTSMQHTFYGCKSLITAPEIPSSVTSMNYTFSSCTSLVTAPEIPSSVTDMQSTFNGCTSLVTAPEIPSSVTSMGSTFSGCTSLVTAPEIPSSVTSMDYTFYGCTSLVTAPEIPSSVTSMGNTFYGCTSLVIAPDIPSSVTYMWGTFNSCTSLVTAPEIPSSVTSMGYTFSDCTKLTGTIVINATPTNYTKCFYNTKLPIKLTGSSTILDKIAGTANNGNIEI